MMNEPCYCGAIDCPECHPGCLDTMECAACGETKYSYEMHDDKVCEACREEGFGECRMCGEIEILVDFEQCAQCWIETREVAAC